MPRPAEQTTAAMREAFSLLQRAHPRTVTIVPSAGVKPAYKQKKKIVYIDWAHDPNPQKTWEKLHNDPTIEVVSERDMSRPTGALTLIRYIKFIPILPEVDEDIEDLWPTKK